MQYPPDPPRPEKIIVVMRQAGHDRHRLRMRALIAVLWPARLRISEALALNETDVDAARGSLLIRHGKRREAPRSRNRSVRLRATCCLADSPTAARYELRQLTAEAGVRRRFAPHQLRHAHAVELAREGVAVNIIQRQLGHIDLGTTSTSLQGSIPQRS